jgi:hypothetical protein
MGVPFEALIPYGIMLAVSPPPPRLKVLSREYSANNRRCSVLLAQGFQRLDTCRTVEREQGIQLINGIE